MTTLLLSVKSPKTSLSFRIGIIFAFSSSSASFVLLFEALPATAISLNLILTCSCIGRIQFVLPLPMTSSTFQSSFSSIIDSQLVVLPLPLTSSTLQGSSIVSVTYSQIGFVFPLSLTSPALQWQGFSRIFGGQGVDTFATPMTSSSLQFRVVVFGESK